MQTRYGDVDALEVHELPVPAIHDDEVLVRVRAASVHPDVWHVLRGRPYFLRVMGNGLLRPKKKIPGTDIAGRIEKSGSGVTTLRSGDDVYGEIVRGHQWQNGGAFAEYVAVRPASLARIPDGVGFEQAAAVPTSGLIALNTLRAGGLRAGQEVLINGAGGGVGSLAVQIAKAYGARVTAVDKAAKLGMLAELGADRVIDYANEDFTKDEASYDLVFDVPGNHSVADLERALTADGVYVLVGHDDFGRSAGRWLGSIVRFMRVESSRLGKRKPTQDSDVPKDDPMGTLSRLLDTGALTPHVDRSYSLEEVGEAIRHLVEGNVLGRSVVVPGSDGRP